MHASVLAGVGGRRGQCLRRLLPAVDHKQELLLGYHRCAMSVSDPQPSNTMEHPLLPLATLLALTAWSRAELKLPAIIADHMVLQQQLADPIWG
ncbi:MAG: hypothetical protein K9M97_07445 [Akkermansiaceae bacterium]|nr:hypothetical protein [Akkermansiaceae bacterium]